MAEETISEQPVADPKVEEQLRQYEARVEGLNEKIGEVFGEAGVPGQPFLQLRVEWLIDYVFGPPSESANRVAFEMGFMDRLERKIDSDVAEMAKITEQMQEAPAETAPAESPELQVVPDESEPNP